MAVDYSTLILLPNYDMWARPVTITPLGSQPPGAAAYTNRGIYDTRGIEVVSVEGALVSDQETILDVRESEYAVVPQQRDQIDIPAVDNIPAAGLFEVTDAWTNGGGETTLVLRKIETATP